MRSSHRRLLALVCCFALLAAAAVQAATNPTCMSGGARRDCGYGNQYDCESNKCCWSPVQSSLTAGLSAADLANPSADLLRGTPWCYSPQSIVGGYTVTKVQQVPASPQRNPGWILSLALYDGAAYFGEDAASLQVDVTFETVNRLRVKITNPQQERWEVPTSLLPLAPVDSSLKVGDCAYDFSYTTRPFGFAVVRRDDGETVFNTTAPLVNGAPLFNGLVFSDQYLELSSQLPARPVLYGLGEQITSLQLGTHGKPITFWARDAPNPVEENQYGSHPFYLENRRTPTTAAERARGVKTNQTTKSHGVWLRNSNGMDVLIYDADSALRNAAVNAGQDPEKLLALVGDNDAAQSGHITYRTIGGILDFFIYVGDSGARTSTPEAITKQYHESVGLPHMPPLWSLGFHACRWGYETLDQVKAVVAGYKAAGIPLQTMWIDIDYMDEYLDFTNDPVNFPLPDMQAFVAQLHEQGQNFVVIVDPGIHNRSGYNAYDTGLQQDVFVKRASGEVFIGKVWPGFTAFPSFFAKNTDAWWKDQIVQWRKQLPVDGIWIDMNDECSCRTTHQPSNFCTGQCEAYSETESLTKLIGTDDLTQLRSGYGRAMALESVRKNAPQRAQSKSLCDGSAGARTTTCQPNDPPYRINNAGSGAPLNTLTIDADATHGSQKWLEYDVHSLYGFAETVSTRAALESSTNKRSLVISRSTFSGSGHHGSHWLGDNWSTWESMAHSISGMLAMQMFGVPLVGADICGFNGDTTEELCARWMALGAFSPFARNHNAKDPIPQEPYLWPSVAEVSSLAIKARYSLLHVYNTLFFRVNQHGGTVMRPLYFNFAQDPNIFSIDQQLMIGSAILITPVLTQGATQVAGYFPPTTDAGLPQRWYSCWSLEELDVPSFGMVTLDAPLSTIPLHVAGGSILPMQQPADTIDAQLANPMRVLVALDSVGAASGELFMDDGSTLAIGTNSLQSTFDMASGVLTYAVQRSDYAPAAKLLFTQIQVLGVNSKPQGVKVNGQTVDFVYNAAVRVLTIDDLELPLNKPFQAAFAF